MNSTEDLYQSFSTVLDGSSLMLDVCTLMIVTWSRASLNAKVHRFRIAIKWCRDRRAAASTRGVYIEMTMAIVATETRKMSKNAFARDTFVRISFLRCGYSDTNIRIALITNKWIFPSHNEMPRRVIKYLPVYLFMCNNIIYIFTTLW